MEALIGFAGVIVGGLLNGGVTAWHQRREQRAKARVAALLVTEELLGSVSVMIFLRKAQTWRLLSDARPFGRRSQWDAHRSTLAAAVSTTAFTHLSTAYLNLEHVMALVERNAGSEDRIAEHDGVDIALTFIAINRGLNRTTDLIHLPPHSRARARRAFRKSQREHLAKLAEDEAALGGTRVRQLIDESRTAKGRDPLDL